jgi:UDP-glucose 4-epimerase
VLVTGGAGFIGSHVADAFVAAGWDVTVMDNLSRGRKQQVPASARLEQLDIASPQAREVVAKGGFEVMCHLAAQIDVRISVSDPIRDANENLVALLNLLEGARAGGTRRVVFSSSGGVVYGEGHPPHLETNAKLPISPYGVTKLASEFYLHVYRTLYGLQAFCLRYANVYGPRQDPHGEAGVVAIFGNRLRTGQGITVFGDGSQTRDYVYVGDVARANLLAATAAIPADDGTIDPWGINIGTHTETSVTGLAQAMMKATGLTVPVHNAAARPGELQRSSLQVGKAQQVLGWKPEVNLHEGLRRTYEWIVQDAG